MTSVTINTIKLKSQLERGLTYVKAPTPALQDELFNVCHLSLAEVQSDPKASEEIRAGIAAVVHVLRNGSELNAEDLAEMAGHIEKGIEACR